MHLPIENLPSYQKTPQQRDPQLWQAAQELEVTFLAEMLKSAGLDGTSGPFGGGPGADQFQSLMREAQARQMVQGGGIGLAESLYAALVRRD